MNPRRSNSSLPKTGRSAYGIASAVVLLFIPVFVLVGGERVRDFLNFGAGVLSLVCLSCSVIWGLVAQDRIFLNPKQRIIGQAVHRTTAVGSIAFLLLHITTKVALDHTTLISAIIPFSLGVTGSAGLIGLGSLAGLLMIFVGITGALRNQFASPAPVAARWRAMHMLAYPAWCFALVHGLYSGREAKPIFVILYSLSLAGVIGALALRAAPRPVKRKVADRIQAIMGTEDRSGREELDASRARNAETASALPGYENARATQSRTPSYETPAPPAPDPSNGFAAAYRAVNPTPRIPSQPTYGAEQTARMDLPMDMQPTEAVPRYDTGGSTSGSWPIPLPPPVGEAPPSAYDPLQDTGYNIPTYRNTDTSGYGTGDVYNTGESNNSSGPYYPNDTYNSGPATDPSPGESYDFDTPGPGEPWNMPSGGYR
ncbi:cytochrome b/b6 domain-containing protein [Streptomyces sp. S3(2020)]|uniref:cytochrome b/b6 domain-containing protein n=1 Tax=Streptomyces sp. S3(2020) TaxID=2732044 RepID=UPI001488253E|nr:cytochrome b/b6 domain-containing protein [Streptomyces sp. S3(2020)]